LTTIHQQSQEMGVRSASMLIDMLSGKPGPGGIYLPVEMKIRKSCGATSEQRSSIVKDV
jgi:DNA-binding LacI/PurR family transcriptional regulator